MNQKDNGDGTTTEIRERHIGGGTEANKLLWDVGEKIQARSGNISKTATYLGSIGIHLYGDKRADGSVDIIQVTQNALGASVDGRNANDCLKKAALDVSRAFGHKLSKKQLSVIKEL